MKNLNKQNFGGLELFQIDEGVTNEVTLTSQPYQFKIHKINAKESKTIDVKNSSIIFPEKDGVTVEINEELQKLTDLRISDAQLKVTSNKNNILLEAQTFPELNGRPWEPYIPKNIKKVVKPWGHELWFEHNQSKFAFKMLFIKSGTKTSLQYHNKKLETMVFLTGISQITYKKNLDISNDEVSSNDLAFIEPRTPFGIHIAPKNLHRISAVSDITMFEMSTLDLDDVIRVQDDSNRKSGRIDSEHS